MPMFTDTRLRVVAAWLLCGFSPLFAATPVAFHQGENLPGLTLDPHGAGAGQIVATWGRGLAAIDAATLEVTELDSGVALGRLAATGEAFYYYNHPVGAFGAFPTCSRACAATPPRCSPRRWRSARPAARASACSSPPSSRARICG